MWGKDKTKKLLKPDHIKELFHFVDHYHQHPKELLLKFRILSNKFRNSVFSFKCCRTEEHV